MNRKLPDDDGCIRVGTKHIRAVTKQMLKKVIVPVIHTDGRTK